MQIKERRSISSEIRAEGRTISGYAAKWNTLSQDLGGFVETLAPYCFDLDNSPDVVLNYDHEDRDILGRTESGTLKLTQDDVGLYYECELPAKSPKVDVDGLIESIARKDIRGCSFAFVCPEDGEEWGTTEDGTRLRTITGGVILYDVCPVPRPAYFDTDVAVRRLHILHTRDALSLCQQRIREAEKNLFQQRLKFLLHRYQK